jgi:hypothetical protein
MKRIFLVLMAGTLVFGLGVVGKVVADTSVPVSWGGSSTFTAETFEFSPFTANSVLGISGSGFFHSHDGTTVPVEFDVILNGSLTSLDSTTSNSTASVPVGDLFGPYPLTFSQGTVSGIRFSTIDPGQFHGFGSTSIVFNSPAGPTPTPEPSLLLLFGSGLVGLAALRKRLK